MPPHAEGADVGSPAGFLCGKERENTIRLAGHRSDIVLFMDHNLI